MKAKNRFQMTVRDIAGIILAHIAKRLKAVGFILTGVFLGAILFLYLIAGEIYEYQDTVDGVHLPEVDAIVCLAGGRGRIAAAGDVWYRYWELAQVPLRGAGRTPSPRTVPFLYVSGMGRQSNWGVLAKQVRRGVLAVLSPTDVVLETESQNTEQNAALFVHYAQERSWEKILLITSRYHMRRARLIFDQVLSQANPPIKIETLSVYQEPFEPGEWRSGLHGVRVTITEYLKWLYYKTFW